MNNPSSANTKSKEEYVENTHDVKVANQPEMKENTNSTILARSL